MCGELLGRLQEFGNNIYIGLGQESRLRKEFDIGLEKNTIEGCIAFLVSWSS